MKDFFIYRGRFGQHFDDVLEDIEAGYKYCEVFQFIFTRHPTTNSEQWIVVLKTIPQQQSTT